MQRTGRKGGWLEDKMRRDDERKQSRPGKLWRRKREKKEEDEKSICFLAKFTCLQY